MFPQYFKTATNKLIRIADKLQVEWMLIGAAAVSKWGFPRATQDVDFTVALAATQSTDVDNLMERAGFEKLSGPEEIKQSGLTLSQFWLPGPSKKPEDGIGVDVFFTSTEWQHEAIGRRIIAIVAKGWPEYWIASKEDLLLYKLMALRAKDIIDLEGLMERQYTHFDWGYIAYWAKEIGILRHATVKLDGERWYVSLLSKVTVEDPEPVQGKPIGLDMGVVRPITDSNGKTYDIPRASAVEQKRLRRLAQNVSRKKKGSNNRRKAQARLNAFKGKMSRRSLHEMHGTTTLLAKNHGMVAYEGLRVKNMTASASGTPEKPGRNVAAKSGLNRAILEVGWGEAKRQIEYKCAWYGSRAVKVPPAYSSQECSQCGYTHTENRPTQALFRCCRCGYEANADHNAAQVILKRGLEILAAGLAVNACGEHVRPLGRRRRSTKQEPTLRMADVCHQKQGIPGL